MSDNKTRHQSLLTYLECLQIEYVNAELRKKIYPLKKDKHFYTRMMSFKKDKIKDIAERNSLSTIFDDESVKADIYSKIHNEFGLPNFLYRNNNDIREFRKWDVINYFAVGTEVKVSLEDGSFLTGTITNNDNVAQIFFDHINVIEYCKNVVSVKLKGDSESRPTLIKHISRIL